jgi:RNA-binding protein
MYRLTPKNRQHLKRQAHQLKPVLIIGKEGLTPSFLKELVLTIDNIELIKCKVSISAWKNINLIEKTIKELPDGITIVDRIGHTLILFKPKSEDETKYSLKTSNS